MALQMDDNRTTLNEIGANDEIVWSDKEVTNDNFSKNGEDDSRAKNGIGKREFSEALSAAAEVAGDDARADDFSTTSKSVDAMNEVAYTATLSPEQTVIMPFALSGKSYDVHVNKMKRKPIYTAVKRVLDFLICLIAVIVLAPLFLIIAIGVKCSSKGPVFYLQERVGYKGKIIKVPKFRTMNVDAEKNGAQWSEGDDDPRIYPFGRFLRKARLDELPQLWCCVIGTMSLVGPRPERECFSKEFEKYIHGWSERTNVKPGITGLAQVNGGYDLKPEEKIVYDLEYIEKRSLWLDVKILFKTVVVVFDHDGAK